MPKSNSNQLNMLGTGNILLVGWQNLGAPVIKNCLQIQAAFTRGIKLATVESPLLNKRAKCRCGTGYYCHRHGAYRTHQTGRSQPHILDRMTRLPGGRLMKSGGECG